MHQTFDPKWVSADDIIKCFTFNSFLLILHHLWQHYYSITAKYTLQKDPNWDAFQNMLLSTPLCVVYQWSYWQMGYPTPMPDCLWDLTQWRKKQGTGAPWSHGSSSLKLAAVFCHTLTFFTPGSVKTLPSISSALSSVEATIISP